MPARSDLPEPGVALGSRRPERGGEIGGCFAKLRLLRRPGLHLSVCPLALVESHGSQRLHARPAVNRQRECIHRDVNRSVRGVRSAYSAAMVCSHVWKTRNAFGTRQN
jgi:hypothetical protein